MYNLYVTFEKNDLEEILKRVYNYDKNKIINLKYKQISMHVQEIST